MIKLNTFISHTKITIIKIKKKKDELNLNQIHGHHKPVSPFYYSVCMSFRQILSQVSFSPEQKKRRSNTNTTHQINCVYSFHYSLVSCNFNCQYYSRLVSYSLPSNSLLASIKNLKRIISTDNHSMQTVKVTPHD